MNSQDAQRPMAPMATPSRRIHHRPSPSLESLYEVLADLEENQLHYLIQEMSHTSDQNVPVSQAVSAFESHDPTDSLNHVRASMLPPGNGLQRQLSKSERGQLRLRTAYERTPSLRQKRRQESYSANQPLEVAPPKTKSLPSPLNEVFTLDPAVSLGNSISAISLESAATRDQTHGKRKTVNFSRPKPPAPPKKVPAYKNIPRPDFDLPQGVTVSDLLQLLRIEFLTSNSHQDLPLNTSSPSLSTVHPQQIPVQQLLTPTSSTLATQPPYIYGSRPLRKQRSRLGIALEAEQTASGFEEAGLGMLEPRPVMTMSLGTRRPTPPVVLEGMFDVLENK